MNNIDMLIAQLCPKGVQFRELGEVGQLIRGNGLQKTDFTENGVGCIHYGQIYTYFGTFAYKTKTFVSPELSVKLKKVQKNDLIIATTSENLEDVCKTVAWLGEDEIVTGGHATIFKHKQNAKYLAYYFQTQHFFDQKKKYARGAKVIEIRLVDIAKIKIPIPPLSIQQEIATILDKFTRLQLELQLELQARRAQYDFYRSELLDLESRGDEIREFILNDIIEFLNGKGHEKHIVENGKYIVVNSKFVSTGGNVKKYSDMQISPIFKNDILMVMSDLPNGKALAKCFLVDKDGTYTLNQRIGALTVKDKNKINPTFLYYILNRNKQLLKYDNRSDQTNLRKDDILSIRIPIPPLAEQNRIVAILDKFVKLVNDISEGLPAEIQARHQQYEYYRGKLLEFKPIQN